MYKLFYSFLTAMLLLTAAQPVMALDLPEARTQGLVIERQDGYIKAVNNDSKVQELVNKVNAVRKAEYQRISKENGQPVEVVAKIAAEEIARKIKN
jgi:uncharacterized protein YdbL (DUF1318 family)